MGESSDEEDVGKSNGAPQHLSYDSDEDKDGSELINLDGASTRNGSSRDRLGTAAE